MSQEFLPRVQEPINKQHTYHSLENLHDHRELSYSDGRILSKIIRLLHKFVTIFVLTVE